MRQIQVKLFEAVLKVGETDLILVFYIKISENLIHFTKSLRQPK